MEVLIAAVILLIAVAGMFSVFTFGKRSTNLPGSQFQAVNLARQQAEELRAAVNQYYYVTNSNDLSTDPYAPEAVNLGSLTGARFYTVQNVNLGDGKNSRKVTITVNWVEPTP